MTNAYLPVPPFFLSSSFMELSYYYCVSVSVYLKPFWYYDAIIATGLLFSLSRLNLPFP